MIDYRKLRPSNLCSPEFSHLLLLLYWPLYGIAFFLVETLRPVADCAVMWIPLDDRIPFNEWFMIPYLFWFVFLVGMIGYLLLVDARAFRRLMYFIMVTYTATIVVYLFYPTCQNLRPDSFARDNIMTRIIERFYAFDTNTNVCPSIHVIGSLAVAFGAWDTPRFRKWHWKLAFFAMALLISFSTVFVKQHSIVDVLWAFAVCLIGYLSVYTVPDGVRKRRAALQRV